MTAASPGAGAPEDRAPQAGPEPDPRPGATEPVTASLTFDRHLVLEQLGGWRGMLDATLPTVAFVVANSVGGLRAGIWAALGCALLLFGLRLARRESVQQAFSGLFGVAIAVAIAGASGRARDFFVPGLVRNAALGVVLLGSIAVRRPLVGVVAEFLAPSHLGAMASHSLPGLRRRVDQARATVHPAQPAPGTGTRPRDPEPERHWRDDPRLMRAYSWLTALWGGTFLVRLLVQWAFYRADEVELLGTVSLLLGLPVTAVEVVITLWVVARLHRHRAEPADRGQPPAQEPRPAA